MGVRITNGKSVIAEYRQPFKVWIAGRKLIFRTPEGKHDDTYYLSEFTGQSQQQVMDLLRACLTGSYMNSIAPDNVEHIVLTGSEDTFEVAIPTGGVQILDTDFYLVFVNGIPVSVGADEFQWDLDEDGNVFFATPLAGEEDDGTEKIVSIYFWYRK